MDHLQEGPEEAEEDHREEGDRQEVAHNMADRHQWVFQAMEVRQEEVDRQDLQDMDLPDTEPFC